MAKSSIAPLTGAAVPKTRKARATSPRHYLVILHGSDGPMLVLAKTQAAALDAVCKIGAASDSDLIAAGKSGWVIVDTLTDPRQLRVDDKAANGAQTDAAGAAAL